MRREFEIVVEKEGVFRKGYVVGGAPNETENPEMLIQNQQSSKKEDCNIFQIKE